MRDLTAEGITQPGAAVRVQRPNSHSQTRSLSLTLPLLHLLLCVTLPPLQTCAAARLCKGPSGCRALSKAARLELAQTHTSHPSFSLSPPSLMRPYVRVSDTMLHMTLSNAARLELGLGGWARGARPLHTYTP